MSLEAVVGVLITVIIAMAAGFYLHVRECRSKDAELASLKEQVAIMRREIGDHETGLRGSLHKLRNDVYPYLIREQGRRRD